MSSEISPHRAAGTVKLVRAAILLVLLLELLGVGAELLLLEHYEDNWSEGNWMKIPLLLVLASTVVLVAQIFVRQRLLVRLVQATMLLSVAGGCLGLYLHYSGNAEFELEMYPSRKGFELFWESLHGAFPALAPGTFIQIGLLGLVYTFRHPVLEKNKDQIGKTGVKK